MQITLYRRTYPVKGAPVDLSLLPHSPDQKHTFTVGAKVYAAVRREFQVVVPDDAKFDAHRNRLVWTGKAGSINSTANEVFGLAEACVSGFRTVQ